MNSTQCWWSNMEGALILNISNTKRHSTISSSFDLAGIASPFSSPWPNRPNRPITILHGSEVIWMRPMHHSHSFCSPIFLAETLGRRALQLTENKTIKWAEKEPRMTTRLKRLPKPVGYIDVDNAGFQELPLLVGTGHKEPPLVV